MLTSLLRGRACRHHGRRLWIEQFERRTLLAVFTVDTLVDENDGNFAAGDFSLREALAQAFSGDEDTINFSPVLAGGTIDVATPLVAAGPLTINGLGANQLAVDGNGLSQVLSVANNPIGVTINDLKITGGSGSQGGGILVNAARLTLNRVVLSGNTAEFSGGAVYATSGSSVIVLNSTVSGNVAQGGDGGGIFAVNSHLRVANSTFSSNTASLDGGGVAVGGNELPRKAWIINSTLSGNTSSRDGGGVSLGNVEAEIINSTIIKNRANEDGDISGIGGGVKISPFSTIAKLSNTIVAANHKGSPATVADDIAGTADPASSHNLIGNAASSGGLIHGDSGNIVGDSGLGTININNVLDTALTNNGGSTRTHSLVRGSPALDRGDNALAVNHVGTPLTTDQRGGSFARFVDGPDVNATATVDIGAYEAVPRMLTVNTLADNNDGNFGPGQFSLREAISRANANAGNDTIKFAPSVVGTIGLSQGEMVISDYLKITGPGPNALAIDANDFSRIFDLNASSSIDVSISNLKLQEGNGEGARFDGFGGAILTDENLLLANVWISASFAAADGGAIDVFGTATFTAINSTFSANTAFDDGGAIATGNTGNNTVNLINSTLTNNEANDEGGALRVDRGTVRITNCTFFNNRANANGLGNSGTDSGGALYVNNATGSVVTLNNTIVLSNAAGPVPGPSVDDDIHGNVAAGSSHNLIGHAASAGGLIHASNGNIVGNGGVGTIDSEKVLVASLERNGGTTPNHALVPLSLAREAGSNALALDQNGDPLDTDQRRFSRISDANGNGLATVDIGAVEIVPPSLSFSSNAVTYEENDSPRRLAPDATVGDLDSPSLEGGSLTVDITVNAKPADRLEIRNQGSGSGQIGVSAGNVLFGGVVIGSFSGGAGTTPLLVSFTSAASPEAVQALVRQITFRTLGDHPSSLARTIRFRLNDGHGGISLAKDRVVNVIRVNDAPELGGISGSIGYTQNAAAVTLAPAATVSDPDSLNFATGKLSVQIISGADASNRLLIGGPFTLSGNDVQLNGVTIGTRNAGGGGGTTKLEITFNANATRAIVEQLVRAIRFKTVDGASTEQRIVKFSLLDGDGGASNQPTKGVNVI